MVSLRSLVPLFAIAVAFSVAPSVAAAQGDPVVKPLPGEPHIQPLDEDDVAAMEAADAEAGEANGDPDQVDDDHFAQPDGVAAGTAAAEPAPSADPGEEAAGAAAMSTAEYAAALREVVRSMRGKVEEKILAKVEAKQAQRMDGIAAVLAIVSFAGLLMLVAPLVLRRRYPGSGAILWKYSAISAGLFFLAVNLFAGVLMVMRGAQDAAGKYTNPQIQVIGATFDLFDKKAEDLAVVGPVLVEPTLLSLSEDSDKPVLSIMLDNMGELREDVGVFASVGRFFQRLDWLFGLLPIVLVLLALVLFIQAARPTLTEIIKLPARAAAEGGQGLARAALASTLRNVWQELKATAGLLGLLILISVAAGLCLGWVLQPAIEIFMAYLMLAYLYVQNVEAASSFWIMFSLGSTILFLTVNMLIMVVATALYLGKGQRIFQQRFRQRIPLRAHARFWKWGTASLLLIFALPVVYILIADPVLSWLVPRLMSESNWALNLGLGPSLFLVTFGVAFWAARGGKAFKLIATYNPKKEIAGIGELDQLPPMGEPTERVAPRPFGNSWQTAQSALAPSLEPTPPEGQAPLPLPPTQYPTAPPVLTSGGYPSLPSQSQPASAPWRMTPPPPPPLDAPSVAAGAPGAAGVGALFDEPSTPTQPQRVLPSGPRAPRAPTLPPPIPAAARVPRASTLPPPIPSAARSPRRVARGTGGPAAIGRADEHRGERRLDTTRPDSTDPDLDPAGAWPRD